MITLTITIVADAIDPHCTHLRVQTVASSPEDEPLNDHEQALWLDIGRAINQIARVGGCTEFDCFKDHGATTQ